MEEIIENVILGQVPTESSTSVIHSTYYNDLQARFQTFGGPRQSYMLATLPIQLRYINVSDLEEKLIFVFYLFFSIFLYKYRYYKYSIIFEPKFIHL